MRIIINWIIPVLFFLIDILLAFTEKEISSISLLLFLTFYSICSVIHLIFHEMGHLIGGKLSNYKFIYLFLGPLSVSKNESGKFCFSVTKRKAGQCAMVPNMINNKKYVLYNSGGLVLNILAVVVAILLCIKSGGIWRLFLLQMIFAGFPKITSNGVPLLSNGLPNDAFILRLLYASNYARKDYNIYLKLFSDYYYNRKINLSEYQYQRYLEGKYDSLLYYNEIQKILGGRISK